MGNHMECWGSNSVWARVSTICAITLFPDDWFYRIEVRLIYVFFLASICWKLCILYLLENANKNNKYCFLQHYENRFDHVVSRIMVYPPTPQFISQDDLESMAHEFSVLMDSINRYICFLPLIYNYKLTKINFHFYSSPSLKISSLK